ncbi:MAG: T9SS type A sorting domain-containing protein [Candidatus Cloacimonetes bacterium]|nr:T9SS type A sorting domain-containing protein [Candidatus Cloacimonadota bacterium]
MKTSRRLLVALCFLSASFLFADWTNYQITDNNYAESISSTALNNDDNPGFAWCSNDDGDYDIYYLDDITGTPVTVTDNSTEDFYPCLQFDQAGYAHIVYKGYDGDDYEEFYTNNVAGDFCEPIQVSFTSTNLMVFVPERSSFAIDSTGIIHVAYKYGYYEYGNWDIYYVNNEGGTFGTPIQVTDGSRTSYNRASIALDSNDDVHLVCENGADIVYTNNISGSFAPLETISEGTIRWHSSIGIDSFDNIHVSYGGYHGGVFYINNVGGSFDSTVAIATNNGADGPTALALDDNDNVHISYVGGDFGNPNSFELYYVNNTLGNFEDIEQLTVNDEHTTDVSMCLDSCDNCHITYLEGLYGSTDYEVWYITNREIIDISSDEIEPDIIKLSNYPNPFNPTTTISFDLPAGNVGDAEITIYNVKGQMIREYPVSNSQSSIVWNGTDESNQPVSSGIYFYQLKIDGMVEAVKKCMLIK